MINFKNIAFVLIIINIFLSAYWLLQGDIHYDRDVARDFLVVDDMIRNQHLTLLGPRSSIPGLFHGPLWFYIHIPVFLIGGGNPILVGWFWFLLSIIFLGIVFYVANKLFDFKTALFSTLFLSVNSIINPSIGLKNFYNPYGAVFLTPIFFWLFIKYINTLKVKFLIINLFILGFIVQFQIAFGIPILFASTLFLIYFLYIKRKIFHFLSYFILLIPLSTFILFDIRHEGLQVQTLIQYFQGKGVLANTFFNIFISHTNDLILNFFDFLSPGKNILTMAVAIFFIIIFLLSCKKSTKTQRNIYWLSGYLFLSFWIISLFFQGSVGNYFWPFLPLAIILFCSFYQFIKKEVFIIVFIILYLVNLYAGILSILDFKTDINKRGLHSWAFNLEVAKKIYQDAQTEFGYFTYSPDRYAYQQRYAMIYSKKFFPQISSFSSAKKPLTYLIEVDPPKDRPELDSTDWKISDIGINREADQIFRFDFIQVEKYYLSDEEIKISVNPLILDYMFVR